MKNSIHRLHLEILKALLFSGAFLHHIRGGSWKTVGLSWTNVQDKVWKPVLKMTLPTTTIADMRAARLLDGQWVPTDLARSLVKVPKMTWTRRPDGVLACGRATIELLTGMKYTHTWYILVGGVVVSRFWGYATELEARDAAPSLAAVRTGNSPGGITK